MKIEFHAKRDLTAKHRLFIGKGFFGEFKALIILFHCGIMVQIYTSAQYDLFKKFG